MKTDQFLFLTKGSLLISLLTVLSCIVLKVNAQDTTRSSGMPSNYEQQSLKERTVPRDSLPVAFGQQEGTEMLQAYDIIPGNRLESAPVSQLEAAMYGQLSGLYLVQNSFRPGSDAPGMALRGKNPLVVIDGVPREATRIDPQQVASISVLKDGLATALYGMRGANGVVLIETKRGIESGFHISFTAETAMQKQLNRPEFVNAYEYATLFNEALQNDGKVPVYTQQDLDAYRQQNKAYTHPDVDWYNTIMNDQSQMQHYNLNISGGSKMARYFVDLDYLGQDGFFISDSKLNTYPTNNFYKRYIFRSNVDVNLTESTLMKLNVFGRIQNGNEPGVSSASIYQNILSTPNNAYPIFNPDSSLGGNQQYPGNLYAQVIRSGYRPAYNRNLSVDLTLRQDLSSIVNGLYIEGMGSLNTYYSETINRSKSFAVYNFVYGDGDTTVQKIGSDGTQSNSSSINDQDRQLYTQLTVGYNKKVENHSFHAMAFYNNDNYVGGSDLPLTNQSIAARVKYNYADKYFVEAVASYMGMNRYPQSHQWGLFPAVGVGYNIAKEDWFKIPAINQMKLRATYGHTGDNGRAGYYLYQQNFVTSSAFYYRNPSTSSTTRIEVTLANPNITWEKANQFNAGVDISLLSNKLSFSVDYYNNMHFDILQYRNTNASGIIGNNLPLENIGKNRYSGVEFSAQFNGAGKNLLWFTSANAAFSSSEVVDMDEVPRPHSYLQRTGHPVNQPFGLVADGFYQSEAEIAAGPEVEGYLPRPGDIRFKDLNDDGVINIFDETSLGSTKPLFFYGLSGGINWKGLDVTLVFQGVANRNSWTRGANTFEFLETSNGGYAQAFKHHLNRWTPENASNATYPRLSVGENTNNQRASSFWLHDGSYMRLKNAEIGYTLPRRWTAFASLEGVRLYVNGLNLLTFTSLERVDPEVVTWNYPNQRVINFGINVQF